MPPEAQELVQYAYTTPACCWPIFGVMGAVLGLIFMRCAWCRGLMEIKRAKGAPGGISDGLGAECLDRFLGK